MIWVINGFDTNVNCYDFSEEIKNVSQAKIVIILLREKVKGSIFTTNSTGHCFHSLEMGLGKVNVTSYYVEGYALDSE